MTEPTTDPIQLQIMELIQSDDVVLFMKGERTAPQCGFSAAMLGVLDKYLDNYKTINVLLDAGLREGIKVYSDWPTIPQLYVKGEFVGGCDIVRQMDHDGELAAALGDAAKPPGPPDITITDAAAKIFREAASDGAPDDVLRVTIDAAFRHDLSLGPSQEGDLAVLTNGIKLVFDVASARRAQGLTIDYVTSPQEGFKLANPNAPGQVRQISPKEVKAWLDAGEDFKFIDVRTPEERATATIEGTILASRELLDELRALPKNTKIVFHCHHGMRSYEAAQNFVQSGFTRIYNLVGGIDAWSAEVDDAVPRY